MSFLFDRQEQLSKFGLDGSAYATEDKVSSFILDLAIIICVVYVGFSVKILSGIQYFCWPMWQAVDDRTVGHNPERLSLLKGGIVYSNAIV